MERIKIFSNHSNQIPAVNIQIFLFFLLNIKRETGTFLLNDVILKAFKYMQLFSLLACCLEIASPSVVQTGVKQAAILLPHCSSPERERILYQPLLLFMMTFIIASSENSQYFSRNETSFSYIV